MTKDKPIKHLLMIVPFFPPNAGGGVYRPLGFVKYLASLGWRTTVIAPETDSYWLMDETLLDDVPESCRVHRTRSLSGQFLLSFLRQGKKQGARPSQVRSSQGFSFLRKLSAFFLLPDSYLGWYPFAVRKGRALLQETRFDAIYSTSPPETSHLIAGKLHDISGLPWIADFRDPWMNLYLLPSPTPLHRAIHERLEAKVCKRASLVVTSRWHQDILRDKYRKVPGLRLISNGYDHNKIDAKIEPNNDAFRILHAGMLTQKRTAVPFLKAFRLFLNRTPGAEAKCEVLFVGPRESENDDAVATLNLQSMVEFRDSVSHAESLKLEKQSHILLLIKHVNPIYNGIVPGKLFEYIGVRRPILAIVPDGEVSQTIRRLKRGEAVAQDDPELIAAAIARMYGSYLKGTLSRDYDLSEVKKYQREHLAGEFAEYLESVVDKRV